MADEWHFVLDGKKTGPVTAAALKELARSGKLSQTGLIWKEGMPQWIPASRVKGLFPTDATPSAVGPQRQAPVVAPPARRLTAGALAIGGTAICCGAIMVGTLFWLFGSSGENTPKAAVAAAPPPAPPPEKVEPPANDEPVKVAAAVAPPPEIKLSPALKKANLLNRHGLDDLAKAELVEILCGNAWGKEKASAMYLLGSMAFAEKRVDSALTTWRELVAEYPDSPEATEVKDRIKQLAEIVGDVNKATTNNAVAESYLRHGDFWSEGRDQIFKIDPSWIPQVEAATKWYDKIIADFPDSVSSRVAHEHKLFTLIGWKDPRSDFMLFGVEQNFKKYMPILIDAFAAFEKEHPDAATLQGFRFQIAQKYWAEKDFDNAKVWLDKIIEAAGDDDTFYRHLAAQRLARMKP